MNVFLDHRPALSWSLILVDIDAFIFQCPKEPFGSHIVKTLALAIHGDPNTGIIKKLYIVRVSEVTTLIAIDYIRLLLGQSTLQAAEYKGFIQGVRQLIIDDTTAIPVNDDK